jgi:hypothetical protein
MPLGAFRQSLYLASPVGAPAFDPGTFQGYFRASSTTNLAAYNTSNLIQVLIPHGCGTLNYVRAKRIPGTTSHIVGVSGSSAIKFYRYTPGTGFVQLSTLTAVSRTCDIAFDLVNNKIYMAATRSTTPFIAIYEADLSASVTTATQLSNPSVLPIGIPQHIRFSNNGDFLAINSSNAPFMRMYQRSGSTFTSITPPSITTRPGTRVGSVGISWNADDTSIAYVNGTGAYRISNRTGSTFSTPTQVSRSRVGSLSFNPNLLYKNVLLVSENDDGEGSGSVTYWSGVSATTTSFSSTYFAEMFQWSPDGLRTLFNTSNNRGYTTDAFNTGYTTSTAIGSLLGARNTFTIVARGFDWMYH